MKTGKEKKRTKKTNGTNGKDNSIVNLKQSTYIITLCITELSTPVKCQIVKLDSKKQDPTINYIQEMYFKY